MFIIIYYIIINIIVHIIILLLLKAIYKQHSFLNGVYIFRKHLRKLK